MHPTCSDEILSGGGMSVGEAGWRFGITRWAARNWGASARHPARCR